MSQLPPRLSIIDGRNLSASWCLQIVLMRRGCSCGHEQGVLHAREKTLRVQTLSVPPGAPWSGGVVSGDVAPSAGSQSPEYIFALLNLIRGESYMQNRDGRERVYSLIPCRFV